MNGFDIKSLKTPDFIKRYAGNPIISADMMPYESVQTYNAGFTKFNGKYVCVFRNDYNRCQENFMTAEVKINLGFATSDDGIHWEVANKPCWSVHTDEIRHVYGRLPNMRESFNTCFSICAQFFGRNRFFLLDFFIFYIMFKSIASEHHQRSQMRDRKICQM
jgi:beta-1,4-mannooligosaccharide/beta-1,4-mannosyl-N-acetylglucosamine phosphorylase